jgi:hypothetical protein
MYVAVNGGGHMKGYCEGGYYIFHLSLAIQFYMNSINVNVPLSPQNSQDFTPDFRGLCGCFNCPSHLVSKIPPQSFSPDLRFHSQSTH